MPYDDEPESKWRVIRWVDAIGLWIQKRCGSVRMQVRVGVFQLLIALPLFVVGFFVNEPFLVYQMSAMALFFTGISTVIAALPSKKKK